MNFDFKKVLDETVNELDSFKTEGEVATYIPELANVEPDNYGIAIVTVNGDVFEVKDTKIKFSMQSMSKVVSLIIALEDYGKDYVFSRIGTEGCPFAFNSPLTITDKAMNPFINAGAISTTAMIKGNSVDEKFEKFLKKLKLLSGSDNITVLEKIYNSEMETTDTNRALSYILRSKGVFDTEVSDVLPRYVRGCSVGVNASEIAHIAAVLANGGKNPKTNEVLIDREIVKTVLAEMCVGGMYQESGKYLRDIGFPMKSGVGGGIMGVIPGKFGICTYAPRLDTTGNSFLGIKILEKLSKDLDLSMFTI